MTLLSVALCDRGLISTSCCTGGAGSRWNTKSGRTEGISLFFRLRNDKLWLPEDDVGLCGELDRELFLERNDDGGASSICTGCQYLV